MLDSTLFFYKGQALICKRFNSSKPNAIAVIAEDGQHLGYVPAHLTAEVRQLVALPYATELFINKEYDAEDRPYYLGQLLI